MLSHTPASAVGQQPKLQRPGSPQVAPAVPAKAVTPDSSSRGKLGKQLPPQDTGEVAVPPLFHHLNFWQKTWVQNVVPFATSLTFHLTMLLLAALFIGVRYQIVSRSVQREQLIIPEAAMVEGAPVGGIPNPGLGGDPNMSAAQNTDPTQVAADGWATRQSDTLTATLLNGGPRADDAADSVIGLGSRASIASSGRGPGAGTGDPGGALAPFGVPGGGSGLGPKSPFMGISGNARRVVYICDASGSMMSVFWRVKDELRKSIDVLVPIQAFNVVFFSDVDVTAFSTNGLVMATPENRRKAIELSQKMSAAGTTDPLKAIRMAFAQEPELIYVLTDGFDQIVSFDAVINEFRKLNVDKKVRVNTILIRSSDNADLERVVKIIAQENGGVCRIIARQDM